MKEEIKKILEMNKTGTLSDDQAAALIEELQKNEERPRGNRSNSRNFSSFIQDTISAATPQ